MTENEFLLQDRLEKIKSMEAQFRLSENAYVSFSGGKDSCVLSMLFDLALPGNKIPRVFFNTGLEYRQIRSFVEQLKTNDGRFSIVKSKENVCDIWRKFGYPMKSKQHSHILHIYQNSGKTISVKKYLQETPGNMKFVCPKKFRHQFTPDFKIKVSDMCCNKMKKKTARDYETECGLTIAITGMRASEGGQRSNLSKCAVFSQNEKLKRFSPLLVVPDSFVEWFVEKFEVELCELYKPPFNFRRTGCIGCPYALDVGKELEVLRKYDNRTFDFAINLWKPIYGEYARLGYRGLDNILGGRNNAY